MEPKAKFRHMIKSIVYSNAFVYELSMKLSKLSQLLRGKHKYTIDHKGFGWIKKDIEGQGHCIQINKGCVLKGTTFHIRGNNNRIVFEENCIVGEKCSFWMEGDNISIVIGSGSTFTHTVHFCAQENDVSILVGKDCMFSNNIIVRTSDSHPIYDLQSGMRMNPPRDVKIGEHVWIAPNTKIMKGAVVGNGAIIGSDTIVTKCIPEDSLAVGHPAKVVKQGIKWTREKLY